MPITGISGGVPLLSFSELGDIPAIYRKAQIESNRQKALSTLGQGASVSDVAKQLFASGDTEGGIKLSQLANQDRSYGLQERQFDRAGVNADRSFGLQEKQFENTQANQNRSFGLQQQQFERSGQTADRSFDLQKQQFEEAKRQHQVSENAVKPISFGGGLYNPNTGDVIKEPGLGETGTFDDATLTALAQQARAGDSTVFQNLGRGAQGAANVVALRKKIAQLNADAGEGGTEQANRNAEFVGVKSGQRTLGTKQANIELAATEFKQVIPIVMQASNVVDRTQYSDLNKIIQSFQTRTGDPNVVRFGSGVNTLINLYSRAISPTGVPTVNDKEHARDILQKAWSQGQFNAAVGMMQQEIDAALASPEKVREDMRRRFQGGMSQKPTSNLTDPNTTITGVSIQTVPPPPGFKLIK